MNRYITQVSFFSCFAVPIRFSILVYLMFCFVLIISFRAFAVEQVPVSEFIGSEVCASCHVQEYADWKGSHHQLAMQEASKQTVLGDFKQVQVQYKQRQATFFEKNKRFYVTTDNLKGEIQTYEISYTFGVYPLQQYVVNFPSGKKQVLDVAWDARPKNEGGQTWYFLGSDHNVNNMSASHSEYFLSANSADDADFHWTGPFYNWNSRCASCHVTEFKKQYDRNTKSYPINLPDQMSEIGVGCESCHGPAKLHITWTKAFSKNNQAVFSGFRKSIKDNGSWSPLATAINHSITQDRMQNKALERAPHTLVRSGPSAKQQIQACAGCHSRRLQLKDRDTHLTFMDNYIPIFIESPMYHADGQVNNENFVWGSFQQSKMHKAGVTCSNCHNPHSTKLKGVSSDKNKSDVCLQCHNANEYKAEAHHKHLKASTGSQCINCHMPAMTFMNVDKRLDHGFRIPNPILSESNNSPNACLSCHQDKSSEWAIQQYAKHFLGNKTSIKNKQAVFSSAFFNAQNTALDVSISVTQTLMDIASDPLQGHLIRASALVHVSHTQDSFSKLPALLNNDSALIRLGVVRSLSTVPLQQKYQLLAPLLTGSKTEVSASVRIEIARQLAAIPIQQLPKEQAGILQAMFDELILAAQYNADVPSSIILLADFYGQQQQIKRAQSLYLEALDISPNNEAALLNLADIHRALNQDSQGLSYLKRAIKAHPNSANAHYVQGLYWVRTKNISGAEHHLKKASDLQRSNVSYAYTYGLILIELNQKRKAQAFIKLWVSQNSEHPMLSKLLESL